MVEEINEAIKLINTGIDLIKKFRGDIRKDTEVINNKLEEISSNIHYSISLLGDLSEKIDNQVIRYLDKSFIFLKDAAHINNRDLRKVAIDEAYKSFTELICLPPLQDTIGTDFHFKNIELIAIGYWGRYVCFTINESYNLALLQIYGFGKVYPYECVNTFESEFFSEDFKSQLNEKIKLIKELHNNLNIGKMTNSFGIPSNQLIPLIEMQMESLREKIIDECAKVEKLIGDEIYG